MRTTLILLLLTMIAAAQAGHTHNGHTHDGHTHHHGTPKVLTKPVRMGSGAMTFDTVPGWGLDTEGKSIVGSTHGGMVVDKAGHVFASAYKGVFVFSPEGKLIRSYTGPDHTHIHDMELREEDGVEYIYGARNNAAEGIKFRADNGKVALRLPFPKESGLDLKRFHPTAVTVAPNGDIFLSDGYASNYIFKFDQTGKYIGHFGGRGNGMKQFNTAHGMVMDTRYDPPRLLICDRNHKPKGRILHYDLDGNFMSEVITGLGMPCAASIRDGHVAIPDLQGRVIILDSGNTIIAILGYNADPKKRGNFGVPQDQWVEGVFSGTHGCCWDHHGNLYVQDWNVAGRVMKLMRVK